LLILGGVLGAVVVIGGKKGWFNRRKGQKAHKTMTYQELSNAAFDPGEGGDVDDDDDEAILGMDGDGSGGGMPPYEEDASNA